MSTKTLVDCERRRVNLSAGSDKSSARLATKYKWYNEFLARYPDRDHYPSILKSLVPADGLKLIIRIKGPAPVPAENYPKSCHEIFEQFAQEPF